MRKEISYVIRQVESFCKANPLGRKLLIVPSKQAGYNQTMWLAGEGAPWVNLRIETPLSLAESYALPALEEAGYARVSADAALFLIEDLLRRTLETDGASSDLRRALAATPGVVKAMYQTVTDLRLAGVRPAGVRHAGIDAARADLVGEIYTSYHKILTQERLFDAADVFRKGVVRLHAVETMPRTFSQQTVAILDETDLPQEAFRFVDALMQRCAAAVRIGRPDFQVDVPAHTAAGRFSQLPLAESGPYQIHPAGQIRAGKLNSLDAELVRVRDAVGVESEVRGVFREIQTLGTPLDAVEIAYTVSDPYLGLIANTAATLEVPITFSEGLPIRLSRPGQAITGYYRWIAEGLDATVLSNLLRSRLIRFPRGDPDAVQARPTDVAEVLEVRRATRGREDLLGAFERHCLQIEADAAAGFGHNTSGRIDALAAGRDALKSLLRLVPGKPTSTVSGLSRSGLTFLRKYFRSASEAEARALQSITDRLEGLADIEAEGPTESMASMLHELLSSHRSGASVARPGHLYAVPVERGGYSGRPHTFVVGLDEGSFPGGAMESPVLLDDDRQRISSDLEAAQSRPLVRTWRLLRMLGALPGPVTLVANRFEIIDGRERYASSVYAQCREDLDIKVPKRYATSFDLSEATSEAEVWLAQRRSKEYLAAAALRYPMLASGRYAAMIRASDEITRFDGYLGAPTPELSLRTGKVVSASRLERLAECPHRYFLQYVLNVRAPDRIDPEDNRWLDALQFGKLVHELLYSFMTRIRERGERADYERHEGEILDLAEQMADEARSRIPPSTELAFRAGLRRLRTSAKIFLAAESRQPSDAEPIHFELKFGDSSPESRHPRPVTLELGDGVTLNLRGSIDRVDRTPDGFTIWDYKTGSSASFDRTDPYKGEKLQWALYAFGFDRLTQGLPTHLSVRRSGYFFVGDQEHGRRITHEVPPKEVVGKYLAPLLELVEAGGFVHFQKGSACRFCDYKSICDKERRDAKSLPDARESSEGLDEVFEPLTAWMKTL